MSGDGGVFQNNFLLPKPSPNMLKTFYNSKMSTGGHIAAQVASQNHGTYQQYNTNGNKARGVKGFQMQPM